MSNNKNINLLNKKTDDIRPILLVTDIQRQWLLLPGWVRHDGRKLDALRGLGVLAIGDEPRRLPASRAHIFLHHQVCTTLVTTLEKTTFHHIQLSHVNFSFLFTEISCQMKSSWCGTAKILQRGLVMKLIQNKLLTQFVSLHISLHFLEHCHFILVI